MAVSAWRGDLRRFAITLWDNDRTEIAAVAVSRGGEGRGWINMHHVKPEYGRIVFLWCCHAAARRPPVDVMYADQLDEIAGLYDTSADVERDAEPE